MVGSGGKACNAPGPWKWFLRYVLRNGERMATKRSSLSECPVLETRVTWACLEASLFRQRSEVSAECQEARSTCDICKCSAAIVAADHELRG